MKDENIPPKTPEKVSCENCGNTHFFQDGGFRYCKKCFYSVGRVFIKEITYKDRCCFKQKSIYKREYHYQNKIEEINKKFVLEMTSYEEYELLLKLQKIDKVIEKINEKWKRKRLINISYLIKRVLSEYDKTKADKIPLRLSEICIKLEQNLNYTFMKKPIQYSGYKSKNRRSNCCIKDINIKSSFFKSFPKGFESVMEYQVIFQNRRIRHEKKISDINQSQDFIQRHILSEIVFKKVFINQTTFDVTFICVAIITQKRRLNIFTKLIMIFNIIDDRLYHFIKRRYNYF